MIRDLLAGAAIVVLGLAALGLVLLAAVPVGFLAHRIWELASFGWGLA